MEIERIPNLVSVIIPMYDRPGALRKCLASVFAQTYRHFEVIAVNDGSKETEEIQKAVNSFPVTKYIYQENKGAPSARNRGFQDARGEFVFFCDADTVLEPSILEKMVQALRAHPEASYSYSGFYFGWKKFRSQPFDPAALKKTNYICTMSLIRAGAFPGFDETLKRFQDWDLWLTMLAQGKTGVFVPGALYRITVGGTMSKWLPSFFYRWFPNSKRVRAYEEARRIIARKHF